MSQTKETEILSWAWDKDEADRVPCFLKQHDKNCSYPYVTDRGVFLHCEPIKPEDCRKEKESNAG